MWPIAQWIKLTIGPQNLHLLSGDQAWVQCKFQDSEMLKALGPKAITADEMTNISMLNTLRNKLISGQEAIVPQK